MDDFIKFMADVAAEAEEAGDDVIEQLAEEYFDSHEPTTGIKGKSPLAGWVGGKHFLAKEILPLIPPTDIYIEPFCGAATIFFKLPRHKLEVLNDWDGEVVNFLEVCRDNIKGLLKAGRFAVCSRQWFDSFVKQKPPRDKVARAWRLLYMLKHALGSKLHNTSPYFNKASLVHKTIPVRNILAICSFAHKRLDGVQIEHLEFERLIAKYDEPAAFFYVDPPYFGAEKYYKKGCFERADHERLADCLINMQGRFLLSYGDCKEIRALYKGYDIRKVRTRYALKNGTKNKGQYSGELLISNY